MAEITVKCSKCESEIKLNIKTIDTLRAELKSMTDDRDYYKRKLAALEYMNKTSSNNPFKNIFNSL